MATAQLRIIVTRVIDPFNFWAHIGTDASLAQFEEFEDSVNMYGGATDTRCQHCDLLRLSQLVLVKCSTLDRWRRAVVVSIDSETEEVDVFYVDYSMTEFVPLDSIVDDVPHNFEHFPRQAWKFTLTAVKPIAQTWISRAVNYFKDQVLGQKHDVQLLHMDGPTVVVDILIREGESQTSLSSMLVNEGFGLPMTVNGDRDSAKKPGSAVPTFDLQSLASQTTLKKDEDDDAESDSDQPNIEQELFAKGVDCSTVSTYSGCSDLDLIAGVPRSPCDTIGNIHSQIQFMRENNEKLAQSEEIRSPPQHEESTNSEEASAPKTKPGKPRGLEWVEGGKKFTYFYPPRRRVRLKGLGKDYESLRTNKGSDDDPVPSQVNHNSPDTLGQGNRHSPTPNNPANRHDAPNPKSQGNHHPSPDSLRQGGRNPSPSPRRQGSLHQMRGGNLGDGDGIQRKSLQKSKSPARSGSSKDREKPGEKTVTTPTWEQLQNEYDWHSSQVTFKVDKILEDITEETCTTKSRELHKLLSTVSAQLLDLPGECALYLSLETIVRSAITDKMSCDLAVKLVESLSGFDEFPDIMRKILLKFHGSVIKVTTAAKTKLQCRNFVFFLAKLFNRASRWEDSDAVTDCIISSLNKWAVFNTKATHSDHRGTSELFSECLRDFIGVGGVALKRCFPNDHESLFKCITEKILANDVARSVKENMLQILINQLQTTGVAQGVKTTSSITMEKVLVAMATKASQTEETARVKTADSVVQVELLPYDVPAHDQLAPRRTSCGSEADSVKSSHLDPYGRVKVMLSDLRLEELLDVFLSNAVRDSLLDVDFADLKDLLKECGVRPGELLEIKTYLAKKAKCQVCDNAASRTIGARNNNDDVWTGGATGHSSLASTLLPQATTVLISPEDFVRPRSATDFNAASQPMAAETVPVHIHPIIPGVNPVVVATTVEQSQKRCSVPPGFGIDVALEHQHMDNLAFSDDDSEDSFDDADEVVSHDWWRDNALRRQRPASSDVTNTISDTSGRAGDIIALGATQGNDTTTLHADFAQSDSEVPPSWLDRDDTLVVGDLPKPPNKAKSTYKRKYSPTSIKNIVDSWLKPNNSASNPDTVPQIDSDKQRQDNSRRSSWGHVTIPTNNTPGTSTAESASPDSTDWPSVTEALAMPTGKAAALGSSSRVSAARRRKKPSTFPQEDHREDESVEAIKHSFGSCQKRVCTLCGSENHLIYDCPRGTRSLFFS